MPSFGKRVVAAAVTAWLALRRGGARRKRRRNATTRRWRGRRRSGRRWRSADGDRHRRRAEGRHASGDSLRDHRPPVPHERLRGQRALAGRRARGSRLPPSRPRPADRDRAVRLYQWLVIGVSEQPAGERRRKGPGRGKLLGGPRAPGPPAPDAPVPATGAGASHAHAVDERRPRPRHRPAAAVPAGERAVLTRRAADRAARHACA